ncbi:MAG: lipocalin family protein [Caulobacterales bacterium]|jgi:apolipoprotein D and lipocalin family protein
MKILAALIAVLALCAAAPSPAAIAAAPQPVKPVPANLYSGRWYEIARTPNRTQGDCQASTSDFYGWASGGFQVVQTCHKGSVVGPAQVFKASGKVLPASNNAKMKLSFFGGLISQEYWILDRSDDNLWAIMATPGGHYVWLLSRRPMLDPATRARALARVGDLGYDLTRLAFPQQSGR